MEKFLIAIFFGVVGILISVILRILSSPKCPKCGGVGLWQHHRKDGSPDGRYKFNSVICTSCNKNDTDSLPLMQSIIARSQTTYFDIATKFKEHDWVVYKSHSDPKLRLIFKVYRDENHRLQPFKDFDNMDLSEYRLAKEEEILLLNGVSNTVGHVEAPHKEPRRLS